jgi:prepilin-type N-terminal cleavage/methylation domain-containing protein
MKIAAGKRNKKGFTLVELVIVIAVLAVLAAIAVPTVTNVINSANVNTDTSNAQTIELALKSAYAEASAGTWTDSSGTVDPSTLKVGAALSHEGLNYDTLTGNIKQKTGTGTSYQFAYDGAGHISCVAAVGGTTGKTALGSDSYVKDAIHLTT